MTAKKDDKPKRRVPDPIPLIGVRGSSTKISLVKTVGVVAGAGLVAVASETVPASALDELSVSGRTFGESLGEAAERVQERAGEIWRNHGTKIVVGGGLIALFGKAFDRRYRDFPVRLGH